nr:tRNA (N6-threonylcarbamoyladenosine(37)-N6)-methyltransferase TrmO [Myxococcota bacterium]
PPDGALPGGERPADPRPVWRVSFSDRAREQLEWLRARGIELEERLAYTLSLGPQPHAYRRIARAGDGWRIAIKEWFAFFRADEATIHVESLTSGVRPKELEGAAPIHREFEARFPRA